MKPVCSFDVFDTVLTRNVYRPHDLFMRIQERFARSPPGDLPEELCRDYRNVRIAAESNARAHLTEREEVTLREILEVIARRFHLNDVAVAKLEEMEIREELASIGPVGSARLLLQNARRRGLTINFVSDMYLSDEVIASMLAKVKLLEPTDGLFVSGRRGQKKSTGTLFQEVLNELQLGPGDLLHVGDYLVSDFLVPRVKLGIKASPLRSARSNAYEALWGERCGCLYCSSIAGASRVARLATKRDILFPSQENALYRLGCNVLGPILVSFVMWVLQQAEKEGIRRLYFLSRDGEIILQVARSLVKRLEIDVDLRYLHVSRTSIFPALMGTGVRPETIRWLRESNIILTVRILADRLKVNPDVLFRELLSAGAELKGVDEQLENKMTDEVCRLLVTEPSLKELLAEAGATNMEGLKGYLKQEQLFDGTPCGLVDLGWHGTIQDVIHTCFNDLIGGNGISGFYFGLDLPGRSTNRKFGYFFDHRKDQNHRFRRLFRILLELLCSGTHGMVLGYRKDEKENYRPVYKTIEHTDNLERIKEVRSGCLAMVEYLDSLSLTGVNYRHVRSQMLEVLKKLFFFPAKDEALSIGGFFFSADQAGHGLHEVAPPLNFSTSLRYLLGKSYAERSLISSWFFGSWARSNFIVKLLIFPLVLLLRINFCPGELLKFYRIFIIDRINKAINIHTVKEIDGGYDIVDD